MVYVTKRLRNGIRKTINVSLDYRKNLLQTIYTRFRFGQFRVSDIKTSYPNISRIKMILRLDGLKKNFWLKKTACGKMPNKDCRLYQLRENRVKNYLNQFGSFDSFDKPKKTEVKIIEKEVPVETTEVDKTEFLGEI